MKSCMECPKHKVIPDPDPLDWFCDDDVAVVCQETPNTERDPATGYLSDNSEFKSVTTSCRPYNQYKETPVPCWCPIQF